jgi:hypothetical protein
LATKGPRELAQPDSLPLVCRSSGRRAIGLPTAVGFAHARRDQRPRQRPRQRPSKHERGHVTACKGQPAQGQAPTIKPLFSLGR